MGYSSTLNGCYSNTQGNLRSAPFTFRKRLERIDWRKIASLDIDQISRDLDFQALQDNVGNVAFCNIECEIDPRCCDPNYIKLFRLAQLIIEYLLHSQDYLSHSMVALEGKCQELNAELAREKKNRQMLDENLKASGEETKKYKKLYCAQRENQNTGTNCHTCPFCPKMFMTVEYLQMHLKRRHLTASPRTAPPPHDVNTQGLGWEKLEEEIKALRHSLELKEKQLQDEQDIRDEMLHKEMEMWKRDQLLGHKKEIEAIRESFITEVKELCRRATNAELGIDCLQKQLNSTLSKPLSPTIYQKEDGVEMLKEQKKEFCKLRKHLTELVESVVCQQLKDQEELLQRKVKVILKEQNHELGKLNSLMQEKMIQNETSTNDDLLLTLCEKTKVQEKLLRQQQKQLQKLYCEQKKHQQMQVQQQQQQQQQQLKELQQQQQQQQQLQQLQQFLPSPNREAKPKERTKRLHRSDTTADRSSDSKDKSSRLAEALQKNPSLVQGLRDEISCMLQEKLEMHGIRPVDQSISKAILKEKLVDLEQERKSMFQKYPDYKKLRKHYEKHLNTIAAEYKHRYEQESRSSLQNSVSGNWKSESSLDNLEEPEKILENLSEIIKKHIENKPQRRHSLPRRAESFLTSPENTSSHVKSSPLQGTKLSLQKIFSQVKNKLSPKKPWKKPLRTTSSPQISVGEKSTTNNNPIEELKVASHLMGNEKTVVIEDEEEEEEEDDDDDDGYEYDTEDDKSVSDTDVNDKPNQTKTMYPSLPSTSQGKGVIIDESEDEVSHTDWDSASELEEMKDTTPIKIQKVESSPNLSALIREKRQGSDNVTKLSQSIEKQLSAPRVKPFGGVSVLPDVNKSSTEKTKSKMIPEEKIEDLSLSSFSDDNNSNINYKKSPVKLLAKESSSSPQVIIPGKSDMQPTANKLDGKEKIIKPPLKIALSSWDSDEDLSEIT